MLSYMHALDVKDLHAQNCTSVVSCGEEAKGC